MLIEDWCQQYPSHTVGDLAFGADGALYVSGGEGASFNFTDYGQDGNPLNPCGDPPAGAGGVQTPPTAEGGALRSQDLRTGGDPVGLSGAILRVDPNTGAGLPGNPLFGSTDPNARRIIAHGARNPFRLTVRPGHERGLGRRCRLERLGGDRAHRRSERTGRELRLALLRGRQGLPVRGPRVAAPAGIRRPGLDICENLYAQEPNAVTAPYFAYDHAESVVAGETCPTGGPPLTGLAFAPQTGGELSGRLRGGALLRRLLPRLHLGHARRRRTGCRIRPPARRSWRARRTRLSSRSAQAATSSTSTSRAERSVASGTWGRQPAAHRGGGRDPSKRSGPADGRLRRHGLQ